MDSKITVLEQLAATLLQPQVVSNFMLRISNFKVPCSLS